MNVEERLKTKKELSLTNRTVLHLLLVHNKVHETLTAVLKPFDTSLPQFNVLRILRGQGTKPANLSTINERMVARMSNTTRLVDKLLAKGLVDRKICKLNRRKVEISITDKGLEHLRQMDKAIASAEKGLLRKFSEEQLKELNYLLDKV